MKGWVEMNANWEEIEFEDKRLRELIAGWRTKTNRLQMANDSLLQSNSVLRIESDARRRGWLAESAKVERLHAMERETLVERDILRRRITQMQEQSNRDEEKKRFLVHDLAVAKSAITALQDSLYVRDQQIACLIGRREFGPSPRSPADTSAEQSARPSRRPAPA